LAASEIRLLSETKPLIPQFEAALAEWIIEPSGLEVTRIEDLVGAMTLTLDSLIG
jgi:hypothetical protein